MANKGVSVISVANIDICSTIAINKDFTSNDMPSSTNGVLDCVCAQIESTFQKVH